MKKFKAYITQTKNYSTNSDEMWFVLKINVDKDVDFEEVEFIWDKLYEKLRYTYGPSIDNNEEDCGYWDGELEMDIIITKGTGDTKAKEIKKLRKYLKSAVSIVKSNNLSLYKTKITEFTLNKIIGFTELG